MYGDLSDPNQVREAMKGIEIVYHVGAAMDGGWDVHRASTVKGRKIFWTQPRKQNRNASYISVPSSCMTCLVTATALSSQRITLN